MARSHPKELLEQSSKIKEILREKNPELVKKINEIENKFKEIANM